MTERTLFVKVIVGFGFFFSTLLEVLLIQSSSLSTVESGGGGLLVVSDTPSGMKESACNSWQQDDYPD